jgi:uncharacterized protein YkwD
MTERPRCRILVGVLGGALKAVAAACVLACVAVAPATAGGADPRRAAVDSLEVAVLAEVNALRARHGLAPLRLNVRLVAAADSHSAAMGERGFFRHRSADGSPYWRRVGRFYGRRGFERWSVGENLLWSSRGIDAGDALRMWLRSRPHRRNLLRARWREIGLSAVHVPSAPGFFQGRSVTIVTANFGVRS